MSNYVNRSVLVFITELSVITEIPSHTVVGMPALSPTMVRYLGTLVSPSCVGVFFSSVRSRLCACCSCADSR